MIRFEASVETETFSSDDLKDILKFIARKDKSPTATLEQLSAVARAPGEMTQDLYSSGITSRAIQNLEGETIIMTIKDNLFAEACRAREAARRIFGRDGEIEFDDGQAVEQTEHGYRVMCWTWVDAADAGVKDLDEEADEDNVEAAYIAAANHAEVDYDETSQASLGDDPGAYVSGWVDVSEEEMKERFQRTVAVACVDSGGESVMFTVTAKMTREAFEQNQHIEWAIEEAERQGYEEPFIPFDYTAAEKIRYVAQELEESGGLTPVDQMDVHGAPEVRDYVVTVSACLEYDDIEIPVQAAGLEMAKEMAINAASEIDLEEAGKTMTTRVRLNS
jgi:hypothetical protein